jgi:predicted Abi (CAAX) family protease
VALDDLGIEQVRRGGSKPVEVGNVRRGYDGIVNEVRLKTGHHLMVFAGRTERIGKMLYTVADCGESTFPPVVPQVEPCHADMHLVCEMREGGGFEGSKELVVIHRVVLLQIAK